MFAIQYHQLPIPLLKAATAEEERNQYTSLEIGPDSMLHTIDQDVDTYLRIILDKFPSNTQISLSSLVHELYFHVNYQRDEFIDKFSESTRKKYLADVTMKMLTKEKCQHLRATSRAAVEKLVEKELSLCCCSCAVM